MPALWCVLGATALVFAARQPAVTPVARTSALARQVSTAAESWRRAVLANDVKRLAAFAWPEERAMVARDLASRDSELSHALWGRPGTSGGGMAAFLTRRGTLRHVVFIRHPLSEQQRQLFDDREEYATGCFHREPIDWPVTYSELHGLPAGSVLCLDWIRDGRTWRVSYDFGYPNEGDEAASAGINSRGSLARHRLARR